jgi:hypothetical protein
MKLGNNANMLLNHFRNPSILWICARAYGRNMVSFIFKNRNLLNFGLFFFFFFSQKTPLYMLLRYIYLKFLKMEKKLTTQKKTLSQPKGEFLVEI